MELPPRPTANRLLETRFDGDAFDECDRCGRAVRRETAAEPGDGPRIPLCQECEFGAD